MKKKKENPPPQADGDGYTKHIGMKLSKKEFDQIDAHVKLLNYVSGNDPLHHREWVEDAIREKLDREKEFNFRDLPEEKHLSLYLDADLHAQLEERINLLKKVTGGYTKKQWVLAAVMDKLNREEKDATARLKKLRTQGQKTTTSTTSE